MTVKVTGTVSTVPFFSFFMLKFQIIKQKRHTHLLLNKKTHYKRFYYNKNNERRTLWKDLKI